MRGPIDDMDVRWTFKAMVVSFGWVGGCSELVDVLALTQQSKFELLVPGRRVCNLRSIIVKLISRIDILGISGEIVARGMPYKHLDALSLSVQMMTRYRLAIIHPW